MALHSNKEILLKRRADFDSKQAENEKRRRCSSMPTSLGCLRLCLSKHAQVENRLLLLHSSRAESTKHRF